VAQLHGSTFTLQTTTHGSYAVVLRPQTQVTEKGRSGRLTLTDGDHVRVRGFVTGRRMTAITVTIIPVKQKIKASSLRGVVEAASRAQLIIDVNGKPESVALTPKTQVAGAVTAPSQIQKNDRVLVRAEKFGKTFVALSIHVDKRQPTGRHIQLHGTLVGVASGAVSVSAGGKHYQVAVTGQTAVHEGSAVASTHDLKAGESVTVYACCQPGSLTATSIHILKPRVSNASETVRGVVTLASGNRLTIKTAQGAVGVTLDAGTTATLGSSSLSVKDIRVGDQVSVRASSAGRALVARSVHVYARSRQAHSVDGTVISVSASGLVVSSRTGKRYTLAIGRATVVSEGGKKLPLSSVHAGDRVKASGPLTGDTLAAVTIAVTPARVRVTTLRGVLVQVSAAGLTVADATGKRYVVRPAPGVRARLKGKTAPTEAVFPGVKVDAKGRLAGTTLTASSITVTVTERTLSGRIGRIAAGRITLVPVRTVAWDIDLTGKVTIADGPKRLSASGLHAGAYVRVKGYVEKTGLLRAFHIAVLHPQISISAAVVSTSGGLIVQTAQGEKYTLRMSSSAIISASRAQVSVTAGDIPVGVKVRVDGMVGADGSIQVSRLIVKLPSFSVRARVTNLTASSMTIQTTTDSIQVTIEADTTFFQTVHPLKLSDIVAGDDVTVYGYKARTILARKILVHRKRLTISGTVSALIADGLTLTAADGPHHLIVSSGTEVVVRATGQQLAVGEMVRVTGYMRGDGVILAIRITITSKP
jgi:hypothetical protein